MNEENKGTPKNKWSRIFRKKWFFPALYLTIAALLLSVVVWYQNLENQIPDATDTQNDELSDDYVPTPNDEDAAPVLEHQEVIKMPVSDQDQAEIVTKFFDYNSEQADREKALILYNNRFYQSTGVDIASASDETFDVVAALSGTVAEVKEDPLLGNVVALSHSDDVMTYYASLEKVTVKAGDKVKQGDQIGAAGKNRFGKDNGTHVHFEIRKDGKEVNPESFFNQPVSSLNNPPTEEASDNAEQTDNVGPTDESEEPIDSEEEPIDSEKEPTDDDGSDVDEDNPDKESDGSSNSNDA